ncbi:outer membrane protein [Mesorhizobium shangrilense]|uniref:Outer membrane protein n=1 Tax=Mesorhizobium shangrilense TaxID=460060 RepID=A0ABV2DKB3_9HYPH
MRVSSIAGSAVLLVSLMAGTAYAADLVTELPIASTYNWTGGYVGAQAGYAWGDSVGGAYFKATGAVDANGNVDPRGFLGGLHTGYNYQFNNNAVLGVEGDINFASIRGSVNPLHFASGGNALGNSASAEMTWNGSVRLRAGYAIDRFLPYVTGGVAFGRYGFDPSYGGTGPLSGSKTQTGWTIGAGLEYALTDHLTTRIEYRYTDFGSATYAIPGFSSEETRVNLKTNDVRIGLTYKF